MSCIFRLQKNTNFYKIKIPDNHLFQEDLLTFMKPYEKAIQLRNEQFATDKSVKIAIVALSKNKSRDMHRLLNMEKTTETR